MTTIDVSEKVDSTEVTLGDLIALGELVLNYAAAAHLGRWASPFGATDYGEPEHDFASLFMRDFVIWTGSHDPEQFGVHRDRVLLFLQRSGWIDASLQKVGA